MEIPWWQIITFIGGSGVVSAALTQVVGLWRDSRSEKAKAAAQEQERHHQQRLQQQEAHAAARDKYLELAANALDFFETDAAVEYGPDVDFYLTVYPHPAVSDLNEVLGGLRRIARLHPSPEVRDFAARLFNEITNVYNELPDPHTGEHPPPSLEEFNKWIDALGELIQLIHLPKD